MKYNELRENTIRFEGETGRKQGSTKWTEFVDWFKNRNSKENLNNKSVFNEEED